MRAVIIFIPIFFLLISGCSQRKDFEPKRLSGTIVFNHFLNSPLKAVSRSGAVLENGEVFSHSGSTLLKLKEHASLINETQEYYIVANDCKNVELINKVTQESKTFPLPTCIIAGNIKNHLLAFVLRDNSYGLLDIQTGQEKFLERGAQIIAVDSLITPPIFLETTAIFPTLDGQIVVVSLRDFKVQRVVIVNSDQFFSNVIYLQHFKDVLVAATNKKILTLIHGKQYEYSANIRDLKLYKDSIFVLTLEGKIIQLDLTMRILNQVELPYALFSGLVISGDKLFTTERLGYLIELDLRNFSYKVYTLRSILGKILNHKVLFYDEKRIYHDRYYLDFSKDWKQ